MVQTVKKVGENRYRESFGRYYEDFVVGDIYEHRPGRTISETDNTWFTLLTMNTHPLHFDAEYAKASEFGKLHRGQPVHGGADGGHERVRRQPEGHRQPGLDRHHA
jgi:acyl dehydratase